MAAPAEACVPAGSAKRLRTTAGMQAEGTTGFSGTFEAPRL
jgi:hypothetical protein